jgi:mannitol-1-phosphate 5-dehydrogenase
VLVAISAALAFDDPEDEQSVELQRRLRTEDSAALATEVTGLEAQHPLFPAVRDAFAARAADVAGSL